IFTLCWGSVGLLRCWSLTVSPKTLTPPRCPVHFSRSLSFSAPLKSSTHEEGRQPLRRWDLAVSPFTTVRAQIGCSISIHPLDPHAYPEADRAFITVHGAHKEQEVGLDRLNVHYDERSKELLISAEKVDSEVSIEMAAPIKSSEGSVQVKNMECDICKVQTEKGNCLLHSVKVVDVKKLQGTKMNVSTEHGPLKVKAIYAESSCISSRSGRVDLGHVHGETIILLNSVGNCFAFADGSNSFLKVSSHSGGIDVYVGDGGSAELHSQEGAVSVRVPSSLRAGVKLCGMSVDISPEVVLHGVENNTTEGYMNGESPADQWVKAQADGGSVRLTVQSWFESRRLGS
uniref:Family with sequence similarity 185 member A n=1 Tax=Amphilophus citrinellus TaxID=61819 RepID=A0A3Q0R6H7_AMPCI